MVKLAVTWLRTCWFKCYIAALVFVEFSVEHSPITLSLELADSMNKVSELDLSASILDLIRHVVKGLHGRWFSDRFGISESSVDDLTLLAGKINGHELHGGVGIEVVVGGEVNSSLAELLDHLFAFGLRSIHTHKDLATPETIKVKGGNLQASNDAEVGVAPLESLVEVRVAGLIGIDNPAIA